MKHYFYFILESDINRDKTMDDILMYIPNDDTQNTPSLDYNWWLKRLETQLNDPINRNQ